MVTLDRIRLTGLLRRKPWKRGFLYGARFAGDSTRFRLRQANAAVSLEPLGPGARPFALGAVPATLRAAPGTIARPEAASLAQPNGRGCCDARRSGPDINRACPRPSWP